MAANYYTLEKCQGSLALEAELLAARGPALPDEGEWRLRILSPLRSDAEGPLMLLMPNG